ncbi:pentatricopeptide repeat-containing protein At3g62890-like [Neltuma alba]|uniref:pentatricopeptide repeat-containing protein At3g62890-like n=1 Tax=Neltuma alba TaxID=207710 RepID=UPI0010A3BFA7|nr:pentatricopeptide repeat-containing protein At3g62890-like [Prosopis alba]XP_028805699.1 pentatricopeptide repeat-containing protein At3g62890-like [Prosopis alba]XP_028805700.1 pentatricopeptide repeat-containing protein At3g62890-like [Prosopis alba]XP_028805701.1 pentatricopeptide repeat-containing protein At3g62890-like [Prosopis alba]XP_028805702.1 pentatricopeptide repeat-containing protein At3g62890-like [Prosopis alba]XP_028805703.1 pentatricopeptide repeat-containing protein At3g62
MIRCCSTFRKPFNADYGLLSILDVCSSVQQIKQTHAQLITTGLIFHPIPANKLLKLLGFSSFGSLHYAHQVFEQIPHPDLFVYNTIIKAHALSPTSSYNSFMVFKLMTQSSSLLPNQYTFVFIFNACGNGLGILQGKQVQVHAIKLGFENNLFVTNALIGMYGKWGLVEEGRKVFDWAVARDMYSWNTMMAVYTGSGKMGQAKELFSKMPEQDVVSWSTIIAGYVQGGFFMEGLDFFHKMLQAGAKPNQFTLVSALAACSNLVALDQGKWIHVYIDKGEIKLNERLHAGLIDMYAKCGEIEFALRVFHEHKVKRKVWPWNAIIGGLAMHGKPNEAIKVFEQMKMEKVIPNKVTFVSLLNACSHGYMVEEGNFYFRSMKCDYGIKPEIEHYCCMVDLLGRAGLLKEAEDMISSMPMTPDVAIWGALLNACRIHKDVMRGHRIGKTIKELVPDNIGCNILLANIYSMSGRWTEAKMLRENGVNWGRKKTPGCSSIELKGIFYQFLVGDRSHSQTKELYSFLDEMTSKLRNAGYVPEFGELLLDIDDEEDKETALSIHSEKLAIAFGLMNTEPGTPLRIVKNLRVCWDCHQATKFISMVYDRVIIVRDRIRYHHFKDGICSCNDYW